jgi:hypothetical protein
MQSTLPLPGHWNRYKTTENTAKSHDLQLCPSRHKAHSLGGIQAVARCMQSWLESTLRHYGELGSLGRISPSRSGSVQRTKVSRATRRLTSRPSSQRRSRAPEEWNGYNIQIGLEHG